MPHAPHAHLHTHVPVLVRTGIDPPRRRTARRLAAAPHARLHRIFSKQRQGLKTRRMVCAHSPSRRPPTQVTRDDRLMLSCEAAVHCLARQRGR